jgi:membrane protease YdiL (CAAX protease family)
VHARSFRPRGALAFATALVLVLSAWNNVVVTRLPGYPGSYVVANVAAAGALLAAARVSRLSWEDLGLARRRLPAGLSWGGASFALVACGYAVALAVPGLRPLLTDARVAGLDGGELAYQVLVRIPLGTVLWEEVAFRGVLLAALSRLVSVRAATAASAAVFGIWPIRPTLSALAANDLSADRSSEPLPYCSGVCSRHSPASCSPASGCAAEASWPPPCSIWRRTPWAPWPLPSRTTSAEGSRVSGSRRRGGAAAPSAR